MNKHILVGYVRKKAIEPKRTLISIPTKDGFGDNQKTTWHNCICFGKTKDFVDNYVNEGSLVSIEGYIDKNKNEVSQVTYTNTIISRLENLTSKKENEEYVNNNGKNTDDNYKKSNYSQPGQIIEDDDIPF